MAKKLDRTRDYGIICGATDGRAFEQDGRFFDNAGLEWKPPKAGAPAAEATAAPESADPAIGEADADPQIDIQLKG